MKNLLLIIILFTGLNAFSQSLPHDYSSKYDFTLNSKELQNHALQGAFINASSYGAFMWLTNEKHWLSSGLSLLTTFAFSLIDEPKNWNAHLTRVGSGVIVQAGFTIALFPKTKNYPYRIIQR